MARCDANWIHGGPARRGASPDVVPSSRSDRRCHRSAVWRPQHDWRPVNPGAVGAEATGARLQGMPQQPRHAAAVRSDRRTPDAPRSLRRRPATTPSSRSPASAHADVPSLDGVERDVLPRGAQRVDEGLGRAEGGPRVGLGRRDELGRREPVNVARRGARILCAWRSGEADRKLSRSWASSVACWSSPTPIQPAAGARDPAGPRLGSGSPCTGAALADALDHVPVRPAPRSVGQCADIDALRGRWG